MASSCNKLLAPFGREARLEASSLLSTNSLTTAKEIGDSFNVPAKDQKLPTESILFSSRGSSLPMTNPSLQPSNHQAPPNGEQSPLQRIFIRGKYKIGALLSPNMTPRTAEHAQTPENSPEPEQYASPRELEKATLSSVPGRTNKFWMVGNTPSERKKRKENLEKLARIKSYAHDRHNITAESGRKFVELEEEDVRVHDFQHDHDRKRKEERKASAVRQMDAKAETVALQSKMVNNPAGEEVMDEQD